MGQPDAKRQVREALDALFREGGDLGEMEDALPALQAALEAFAADDFVCAMCPLPPTPPTIHPGVEGVVEGWRDFGGTFASVRARLEGIVESETHLVVLVDQIAVTRHGGVEMHQPSAMLWSFRDGLVNRLEFHLDQDAALRAAGVEG